MRGFAARQYAFLPLFQRRRGNAEPY
jgi:hypothetical protein